MAGGLLVSTGMVTASFSQKVYHMYLAIGIISGKCFSWAHKFTRHLVLRTREGEFPLWCNGIGCVLGALGCKFIPCPAHWVKDLALGVAAAAQI